MALAVSGGVDSLAMVFLATEHNRRLKNRLQMKAIHVCLDTDGETRGLRSDIVDWLSDREAEVVQVPPRFDGAQKAPLDCYTCSRARRRTLIESAERMGARCVALGHHADDVVETWMLSLSYTGSGETMPPVRSYFDGVMRVVRPLYELRKREIRRLARLAEIPEPMGACGRESEARRNTIRAALAAFGRDQDLVRRQLYWAALRQLDPSGED